MRVGSKPSIAGPYAASTASGVRASRHQRRTCSRPSHSVISGRSSRVIGLNEIDSMGGLSSRTTAAMVTAPGGRARWRGGGRARSAALALLRAGFEVDVYEQAGEVSEVGAGINISPNASRVLHGLGLDDALAAMGVRPVAFHQRRWEDGRTLVRTPFGDSLVEAFG